MTAGAPKGLGQIEGEEVGKGHNRKAGGREGKGDEEDEEDEEDEYEDEDEKEEEEEENRYKREIQGWKRG